MSDFPTMTSCLRCNQSTGWGGEVMGKNGEVQGHPVDNRKRAINKLERNGTADNEKEMKEKTEPLTLQRK